MACMAEAFGRNGSIRYGSAFHRPSGSPTTWAKQVPCSSSRLRRCACSLDFWLVITGCRSRWQASPRYLRVVWAAFLFLLALYLLAGKSLNFSTALSALLGAVSICLVLIISLVAIEPRTMGESLLRQCTSDRRTVLSSAQFCKSCSASSSSHTLGIPILLNAPRSFFPEIPVPAH